MKGKHIEFAAGLVAGAVLFGGGAAYAAGILAERSYQTFYVNDKQVELEAYAINGHNYSSSGMWVKRQALTFAMTPAATPP